MKRVIYLITAMVISGEAFTQGLQRDLDYWRYADYRGVNLFEPPKISKDSITFDGVRVRVGGAFALQFQGLSHSNQATAVDDGNGNNANELIEIGGNFNLPTANLDLDVALAKGVRMH